MTQEADYISQQRMVIQRMAEHSRRWQTYGFDKPLAEFDAQDTEAEEPTAKALPWAIGAAFSVALFAWLGVWIYDTCKTPDTVLTFVQPIKNNR